MTKDEALKMAIEALDSCDCAEGISGKYQFYNEKLIDPAINACKEALATNKESSLVQPAQKPSFDDFEFAVGFVMGIVLYQIQKYFL